MVVENPQIEIIYKYVGAWIKIKFRQIMEKIQ